MPGFSVTQSSLTIGSYPDASREASSQSQVPLPTQVDQIAPPQHQASSFTSAPQGCPFSGAPVIVHGQPGPSVVLVPVLGLVSALNQAIQPGTRAPSHSAATFAVPQIPPFHCLQLSFTAPVSSLPVPDPSSVPGFTPADAVETTSWMAFRVKWRANMA